MKIFYNKPVDTIMLLMENVFIDGKDTNPDRRDHYFQVAYSFRQLAPDFRTLALLTADEVQSTVECYFDEKSWYTYIDTAWHLINDIIAMNIQFPEARSALISLQHTREELLNWMDEWSDAYAA